MAILVTGGTGFIGAEIVRQLLERETGTVYVLHRSDNRTRLGDLSAQLTFIQADLADYGRLAEIVAAIRPEVIVHLGAMLTGPGEADPQAALQTNAFGTHALLEAARLNGVRQFLFASSIGTYGADLGAGAISDATVQRPLTMYGITKVFGEQLGAYYRRAYGLDFRGLRYPSIVGPGVKTPSVVQFTSWMIEESARGRPFTVVATPETAVPILYYKDAARAMLELAAAPFEAIRTVTYLVDGVKPTPTAAELAALVQARLPQARITFAPDPALQAMLDALLRPLDDSRARAEWGWRPTYGAEQMVEEMANG